MPWAAQKCTHLTSLKIIEHPKMKWPKANRERTCEYSRNLQLPRCDSLYSFNWHTEFVQVIWSPQCQCLLTVVFTVRSPCPKNDFKICSYCFHDVAPPVPTEILTCSVRA